MDPKRDLVRHYRWLRVHGLNDSHSGNGSVRDGDTIWVTPTGCCADILAEDELVRCSLDQPPPDTASLDAPLHLEVYRCNPGANAVLHGHGPYCIASTLDGEPLSIEDFEGSYYFSDVPLLDIPYQDYLRDSPAAVGQALSKACIAIVRGHGVYACVETLNRAYKWLCSLEASARITHIAEQRRSRNR